MSERALPPIRSATEIMNSVYPAPKMVVESIIPDSSLVVLAGPKASGKTQFLLSVGAGVAAGGRALGRLRCNKSSVLYIQLELSERRIHERLHRMGLSSVDDLHFPHADRENRIPAWRIGGEGVADIRQAIKDHGYGLVIIDVLQKIWPDHLDLNSYQDSYKVLGALRQIAAETETTIIVATHYRKAEAGDVMDRIMGSVGVVGNSDVVLGIERQRGSTDGVLTAYGNDIPDLELSMQFDPATTEWLITDKDPREAKQTPERRKVLEHLREHGPLSLADLSEGVEMSKTAVSNKLRELRESGLVNNLSYGIWTATHTDSQETPERAHESRESVKVDLSDTPEDSQFHNFHTPPGMNNDETDDDDGPDIDPDFEQEEELEDIY